MGHLQDMVRWCPQIGFWLGFQPLYPGQLSNSSALTATIGSSETLVQPHAPRPCEVSEALTRARELTTSNHVP